MERFDPTGALQRNVNLGQGDGSRFLALVVELDRNYDGVPMLRDHLSGTFQREDEPSRFGLTRDIDTFDPVRINTHALVRLWRDLRRCVPFRERLRLLIGPLGGPGSRSG